MQQRAMDLTQATTGLQVAKTTGLATDRARCDICRREKKESCRQIMIKNYFRTLFGIRKRRTVSKPGPMPPLGTTLVRGQVKMRVTESITQEQWLWLTLLGWRSIDMRSDRRAYASLSSDAFARLIGADRYERDTIHEQVLKAISARDAK